MNIPNFAIFVSRFGIFVAKFAIFVMAGCARDAMLALAACELYEGMEPQAICTGQTLVGRVAEVWLGGMSRAWRTTC